jgi:hypothetical protein
MLEAYFSWDGVRALAVAAAAVAQAVMAYWPEWRKWPETVPSRSAKQSLPIVPIEWAFAIWGLIYLGAAIFAVWQILPDQLDDPLLRRIGYWAAAAFALNAIWEYHVPKRDLDWASVAIIGAALAVLLTILVRLEAAEPLDARTFWLTAAPLQLLAGWISAATFVNIGSTLKWAGVAVGRGLRLALLLSAGALGASVAALTGALVYAAAVAWALFGIVVANRVRDHDALIAAVAALLVPVVLAAAWFGG